MGSGHLLGFDDQVAWLVTHTSKSAVSERLRVAWRTVGSIITRVVDDARAAHDPFDGLRRIGIDEISSKRGHKYLSVVVDHHSGRLVWAAVGRDKATLEQFFDLLGEERSHLVKLAFADAAEWIAAVVATRCPTEAVRELVTSLGDIAQALAEATDEERAAGLRRTRDLGPV